MTLEKRNGGLYYYRSVREGERVRKVYVGAGELGEALAKSDQAIKRIKQAEREEELERARQEVERMEALAAPVVEIHEAAEILARAALVASGYHRHKGEWRRARST